jgi:hypothetical protein
VGPEVLRGGTETMAAIAPEARALLGDALARAFHVVFLVSAGLAVLAFLVTLRLEDRQLRTTPAQARGTGR